MEHYTSILHSINDVLSSFLSPFSSSSSLSLSTPSSFLPFVYAIFAFLLVLSFFIIPQKSTTRYKLTSTSPSPFSHTLQGSSSLLTLIETQKNRQMSSTSSSPPSPSISLLSPSTLLYLDRLVLISLEEDVRDGDLTTLSTISSTSLSTAHFLAKSDGVLSGLSVITYVAQCIDKDMVMKWRDNIFDGVEIKKGEYFGTIEGKTSSLLVAERLLLNIIQRMSGIATATHLMVNKIRLNQSKTLLLDTRKTAPGLRILDKMGVLHGGGVNHRMGLYDMIMIKDNHITGSGGIRQSIQKAKEYLEKNADKKGVKIEVETRTLEEVKEVMEVGGVDRIMLDNMVKVTHDEKGNVTNINTDMLQEAMKIIGGKYETEASGNVTLETVGEISKTGVTYISTGSITHSVMAMDISLKIKENKQ